MCKTVTRQPGTEAKLGSVCGGEADQVSEELGGGAQQRCQTITHWLLSGAGKVKCEFLFILGENLASRDK